jgi:outer membrane protein
LVTAQRDQYVAGFALLNAMGKAEADDLGLDGGSLYNPIGNYQSVHNRFGDWSDAAKTGPKATRTVGPTPVDADVQPLPPLETDTPAAPQPVTRPRK